MMMDLFQDNNWDFDLDHSPIIDDFVPDDFYWNNQSACMDIDVSPADQAMISHTNVSKRKRGMDCSRAGAKAFRQKVTREKMNDRFTDVNAILEHGKPQKSDKSAIISDVIRAVNQLQSDAQKLRETNDKLREDIKNLKAEKHEQRGEKNLLKMEKEKIRATSEIQDSCSCCIHASNCGLPRRSQEDDGLPGYSLRRFPHVVMDFSDTDGHNSRSCPQASCGLKLF